MIRTTIRNARRLQHIAIIYIGTRIIEERANDVIRDSLHKRRLKMEILKKQKQKTL